MITYVFNMIIFDCDGCDINGNRVKNIKRIYLKFSMLYHFKLKPANSSNNEWKRKPEQITKLLFVFVYLSFGLH